MSKQDPAHKVAEWAVQKPLDGPFKERYWETVEGKSESLKK